MADNYLITGYWGEPHVTPENDRGINAAIFGAGRFVLPVGKQFRAEYIGNNTVRMYDGKLIDNGAVAGIPAGEYIDLFIPEAGQGMKRNDLIVFQYSQDTSTLIEKGEFKVLSGTETTGTASDPELSQQDILSNTAKFDQLALWRVPVSGSVISAPVILYNTKFAGERIATAHSTDGATYTVELPGIAKLYTGLEITIIPDKHSTTTLPKLNINGLGDVNIKRRISGSTSITVQSEAENFLIANQPIRIFYNGSAWICDMARPHATDIYGSVPIECGGTGADNAAEALANLGAAPAGFGLGEKAVLASDCNTALNNGWYYCNSTTAHKPASVTNCTFFVLARNTSQIYQYFFTTSEGCVMQRYTTDGGSYWVEEWINPPMDLDTEYRTTERWNGNPVYTKTVYISSMPKQTTAIIPHDITVSISNVIRVSGSMGDGTTIPYYNGGNRCFISATTAALIIDSNYNVPATYGYATIWYTK